MFLHSEIGHLAGNMLYLWIFGNNIEAVLGKFKFVIFYMICGTITSMSHIFTGLYSEIPMVGASGAISVILGGYLILFITWIRIQVFSGIVTDDSGIAWFAHIGGFVAGMLLILPFHSIKH